jgi:transcriptional regulator with XRE-family HTH domain
VGICRSYTVDKERVALGARLRSIREEKNMTKYRIAKDADLSDYTVYYIENGSTNYTIDALVNYLDAIDYNLNITEKDSSV